MSGMNLAPFPPLYPARLLIWNHFQHLFRIVVCMLNMFFISYSSIKTLHYTFLVSINTIPYHTLHIYLINI